ncbi:MAG: hypothetical protein ABF991_04205 [Liquorilactobacillus hordei]|uniref:Uncharacterized protein n=2 Tax=Liquorilactobacillus hordei TaxID=468911 RepID=A0A0R1MI61_9LACO|nr:hypothetical protein [Liquorilactobacillus hordei]AUJ30045.1 hypothetical protein BSQ49_07425 [Liquorilactobacillus hordei]KRL07687.1 hypothetical protein FC92_GL001633 [Liquorilactobacillus hordei DSM 19519]QYH52651.1 hypothetical protein G6O70_09520 [Liquorilactobacillus hordei DSM 19519]
MRLKDKVFGNVGRHSQQQEVEENNKRARYTEKDTQEESPSRTQQRQNEKNEIAAEKKRKLIKKLNWIIAGLFVAIICVYCFMIFVNF